MNFKHIKGHPTAHSINTETVTKRTVNVACSQTASNELQRYIQIKFNILSLAIYN